MSPEPAPLEDRGTGPAGRVLYVTYDGLLEPLGASQVIPYVRGLAAAGVAMEILSFEKPVDLEDRDQVRDLETAFAAAGIRWTRLVYHKRPTLPATAWDVAQGRRRVADWARRARRAGVPILVHARGYLPGLMGLAARRSGGRILFDMRGFWVDERVEGGYWAPGSIPVRVGRVVERMLLRQSDHLILLTRRAAGRLAELAGGCDVPPWTVIPTCVDLHRFAPPDSPAEARRALGIADGPVLIHVGTLSGWYDGPATMEVARAFLEQGGGTFIVLTREPDRARSLARGAGVEALVASSDPTDVPRWLQAADAGLALVRPSPSKDASFPTKVGEYLAAGLAVLATPVGDLADIESQGVLRLMGVAEDPAVAAAWLLQAAGRPDRVAAAQTVAQRELGLEQGVARLLGVYRSLGVFGRAGGRMEAP